MGSVWIAGSYQSDYARNYAREGLEISDMVAEAVTGTLQNAQVAAGTVEAIHVGNAFGQLFTGQGQLGAMPATVEPALWGKPAARHEAACASGSVAVLAAMADIEAGRYDCVLVIGVEQERNVPGTQAPAHLAAAAWIGHEGQNATFMWPYMFSELADEYDRRYGLDDRHLHAIAELNMRNAKDNAGRHRDPRLLLDAGVHGHRPLRHHRARRELEGGGERGPGAGRRDPGQPQRRPDRTTCPSTASCPAICTASTCATPRTRCTRPSSGTTPSTATG